MDAESYARVRARFEALADLTPEAREQAIANAGMTASELALLRQLLAADGASTREVAEPAVRALDAVVTDIDARGQVLGAWTLDEPLGRGGMGMVYAAHRSDGQYTQRAAVKLLRGLPSPAALERLARERQILADLVHPNIARLLDGGTTPDGQPYLVMERIDGEPIDRWCAARPTDPRTVLALLCQVCAAVAHAHAQLIVHCDLKPSNVLVDGAGRPVLLDFGIARALEGDASQGAPSSSSLRARAFTPGFASPEQERGEPVGTATDVYSLGRLLEALLGATILRRDAELAAVVARATAAEPGQRYASAAALETDLAAWLAHRPLTAVDGGAPYRLRKALRRHWALAVVALAAAMVAAFAGWQVVRERDRALAAEARAVGERDRAEAAARGARQVGDFVVSILDAANPDAGGGEVPVRRLVEQAAARVPRELAGQSEVQAEIYVILGDVQARLKNAAAARDLYLQAIDLERPLARPQRLASALIRLARIRRSDFPAEDVAAAANEALALYRADPATDPRTLVDALRLAGGIQADGHALAAARVLLDEAVARAEAIDPRGTLLSDALEESAGLWMKQSRPADAEPLLRRSLALRTGEAAGAATLESTLNARSMLGRVLSDLGQVDQAEVMLRQALADQRALAGGDTDAVAWRLSELARVLSNGGRVLASIPVYEEALDVGRRKLGADSPSVAVFLNGLAISLLRVGDAPGAIARLREARRLVATRWGATDPGMLLFDANLAEALLEQGEALQAQALAQAVERARAAQGSEESADLAIARQLVAAASIARGDPAGARRMLGRIPETTLAAQSKLRARQLLLLARADAAEGNLDLAIRGFEAAATAARDAYADGDPRRHAAELPLAETLRRRGAAGDAARATQVARDALQALDPLLLPGAPLRARLKIFAGG